MRVDGLQPASLRVVAAVGSAPK